MFNKLSRLFENSVKIAMLLLFIAFILHITGIFVLDNIEKSFVITMMILLWLLRIEMTVDKVNEKLDRKTRVSYTYKDENGEEKTVTYLIE
ncbi:hypothetical protein ACPEEL_04105 [Pasteurella sp. PK-2025]|uniref:hypothetical protein n=1 Tax=Pasteurella sp. PK-2025 TaxID=3413133 RepID=UPI003C71A15F